MHYEAVHGVYDQLLTQNYKKNSSRTAKAKPTKRRLDHSVVAVGNFVILGLLVGALFAYIFLANSVAAKQFSNRILQEQIANLSDKNGALEGQKTVSRDTLELIEFAQRQSMVPASDAVHIFEKSGVALQH